MVFSFFIGLFQLCPWTLQLRRDGKHGKKKEEEKKRRLHLRSRIRTSTSASSAPTFYSAVLSLVYFCQKERMSWVRGREGTGILRQSDSSEIHPKNGFPGFPETANYLGFSAKSWTENAEGIKFTPFVKQTLPFLY